MQSNLQDRRLFEMYLFACGMMLWRPVAHLVLPKTTESNVLALDFERGLWVCDSYSICSETATPISINAGFRENIHLEELDLHENGILRIENIGHLTRLATLGTATLPAQPAAFVRFTLNDPPELIELGNNAISSLRSGLKSLTRLRQVTKLSSRTDKSITTR